MNRKREHGKFIKIHGMYGTRLYNIFRGMINRCNNINSKDYPQYGGRGIKVCKTWVTNPKSFFEWSMANGYEKNLTIDRIDNNKGYSPDNCRWLSSQRQQRNKRTNRILEYNGEKHCLSEWTEILGIPKYIIESRIKKGWTMEKILTEKYQSRNKVYEYKGMKKTLSEWAKVSGVKYGTIYARIKRGWPMKEVIKSVDR